jgi:hypothetical protein
MNLHIDEKRGRKNGGWEYNAVSECFQSTQMELSNDIPHIISE